MNNLTLEERQEKSKTLTESNPDRVPSIIENKSETIQLKQQKFLIPKRFSVNQLIVWLENQSTKQEIKGSDKSKFIMANKAILLSTNVMSTIYEKFKNEDGFLYLTITENSAMGAQI